MGERDLLLSEVAQAVARFQSAAALVDEAAAQRMGINRTDLRCLGLLHAQGPMNAGRLGAAADLSPGATTVAVDRLERAGYVRRTRTGEDRRAVLVEMTPIANERLREIYGPLGQAGLDYIGRFSEAELRLLRDFLIDGYRLQVEHAERVRASSTTVEGPIVD